MITKEDWVAWKSNPVTKAFLNRLNIKREELKEGIAEGQAEGDELQRTIGRCMSLIDVLQDAKYNFLEEGEVIDN